MWFSDATSLDSSIKTSIAEDSPFRTYYDINLKPIAKLVDPSDPGAVPDTPVDIYTGHPWKYVSVKSDELQDAAT